MPCFWRLPVNAHTSLVALCRPITFLSALVFALGAFAVSTFLNISGLAPPECPHDKSTRTRPRPLSHSPTAALPSPPAAPPAVKPSPLESLSSFSSFVADSFRPHRPPPVARRGSHNKSLPYPVHELDEVVEEEDGETTEIPDRIETDGEEPGLTPDVSEGEETSSVETVEDVRVEHTRKPRAKGVNFFTGFKWRKNSSEDSISSPANPQAPRVESGRASSASPTASGHSIVSPPKSAIKHNATRPRSATSSTTSGRSVHFTARRQTSLDSVSSNESNDSLAAGGGASHVLRSRKPLSINTSSTPSQARTLFSKSSFRSLSPLSRSPVTTPEPSPPSSPRTLSANCPFQKHIATRLNRSHSVDSHSNPSRGRRTRATSPTPHSAPRLRRGMSASEGLGIDSTGSSDLKLDDLLR
ncbi:hypothetical protein JCM11491_006941 [Sporobolomyces phaffii]